MKRNIIITGSANTGIGLWTSICLFFANIFGYQCKALLRKQKKVLEEAKFNLNQELKRIGRDQYQIRDFRVVQPGLLSVTMTALAEYVGALNDNDDTIAIPSNITTEKKDEGPTFEDIARELYGNK